MLDSYLRFLFGNVHFLFLTNWNLEVDWVVDLSGNFGILF